MAQEPPKSEKHEELPRKLGLPGAPGSPGELQGASASISLNFNPGGPYRFSPRVCGYLDKGGRLRLWARLYTECDCVRKDSERHGM